MSKYYCSTSISKLTLSMHQNMMYWHDYAPLIIRSCYYVLKRQSRCKIYVQNLLFYLSGYGGLRVWLKIPKNKNKSLLSKPIVIPAAEHMPIKSNIINQPVHLKNYCGGHQTRVFSCDFLEPYLTSDYPNTLDMKGHYYILITLIIHPSIYILLMVLFTHKCLLKFFFLFYL